MTRSVYPSLELMYCVETVAPIIKFSTLDCSSEEENKPRVKY